MAEEITGSRYQPGRGPVGGEREKSYSRGPVGGEREVRGRLLRGARGVSVTAGGVAAAREITGSRMEQVSTRQLDAASQTLFTESESDVRESEGVRGGPL